MAQTNDANQGYADEHHSTFVQHRSQDDALDRGDRGRLAQVFSSLLSDAAKFAPTQSKIIILTTADTDPCILKPPVDKNHWLFPEVADRFNGFVIAGLGTNEEEQFTSIRPGRIPLKLHEINAVVSEIGSIPFSEGCRTRVGESH